MKTMVGRLHGKSMPSSVGGSTSAERLKYDVMEPLHRRSASIIHQVDEYQKCHDVSGNGKPKMRRALNLGGPSDIIYFIAHAQ